MCQCNYSTLITPIEAARRLGIDQVAKNPHRTVVRMARQRGLKLVNAGGSA